MQHSPGFLKVVNEAKPRVKEISVEQARERLKQNPKVILIDVREDMEWKAGHAVEAIHLGKGVL
jgi:rhodanese-related sulfurtransferase